MKTSSLLIIVFLLCLFNNTLTAQTFEGVIVYNYSYTDKTGFLSKKEAKKLFGTEQTLHIKNGKYKSRLNGISKKTHIYPGNDTLYMTQDAVRAVMWIDAEKQKGEILSHNLTRGAKRVKGMKCDLLTVKTTTGTLYYYFSDKYKVDSKLYAKHQYNCWAFCLEKAGGALPLKLVIDKQDEIVELTYKKISKEKISNNMFALTKGVSIIPAPERDLLKMR